MMEHHLFSRHIKVSLVCAFCVAQGFSVVWAHEQDILPEQRTVDYDNRSGLKVFLESFVAGRAEKNENSTWWNVVVNALANVAALLSEQIPTPKGPYSLPHKNKPVSALQKWKGAGLQVLGTLVRMGGNLLSFKSNNKKQFVGSFCVSCAGWVAQEEGRKLHPGIPPVMVTVGDGQITKSKDNSLLPDTQDVGKKLATTIHLDADLQAMGIKKLNHACVTVGLPLVDKSYGAAVSVTANKKLFPTWMGRFRPLITQYEISMNHPNVVQNVGSITEKLSCWFVGWQILPGWFKGLRPDVIALHAESVCEHDNILRPRDNNKMIYKKVAVSGDVRYSGLRLLPAVMGRLRPSIIKLKAGLQYNCDNLKMTSKVEGSVAYDETLMPNCLGHARPQITLSVAHTCGTKATSGDVSARFKKLLPWLASFVHTKKGKVEKVLQRTSCLVVPTVQVKADTHGDWKHKGNISIGIQFDNDNDQKIISLKEWLIGSANIGVRGN